jgi:Holliday junction resolvase
MGEGRLMANYAKGRRREYRTQAILEAAGYQTMRAASSKGVADVIGVRRGEVRFISVKSGSAYASGIEREALAALAKDALGCYSVEIWRFPARCREPLIEVL